MKVPLIFLAVLAAGAGFFGIPGFISGGPESSPLNATVAWISSGVTLAGMALGTVIFAKLKSNKDPLEKTFGLAYQFVVKKYYLDDLFIWSAGFFQYLLANILFWFDRNVVMQMGVNGAAGLTRGVASFVRKAQDGRLKTYAMIFCFGVFALVSWTLLKSY
jgi:NADH-quinone oxidoreductase subunit L